MVLEITDARLVDILATSDVLRSPVKALELVTRLPGMGSLARFDFSGLYQRVLQIWVNRRDPTGATPGNLCAILKSNKMDSGSAAGQIEGRFRSDFSGGDLESIQWLLETSRTLATEENLSGAGQWEELMRELGLDEADIPAVRQAFWMDALTKYKSVNKPQENLLGGLIDILFEMELKAERYRVYQLWRAEAEMKVSNTENNKNHALQIPGSC